LTERGLPGPDIGSFDDKVVRIVESQEQVATTKIAGNLEEQDLLEAMLENSKPGEMALDLHYLLSTPFRYPPLRYGSRFGSEIEPSLFYASLELETCLQECAYYRFIFWYDMEIPPPGPLKTQHTVFSVDVVSTSCVDLRNAEYDDFREQIRSTISYGFTQNLGADFRQSGVDMIIFESARGPGNNVAIYAPTVFAGSPCDQALWNSEVSNDLVFLRGPGGLFRFPLTRFSDEDCQLLRV
jgi:hypothetical protein